MIITRIVMLGKWPSSGHVSGGVAAHTVSLVKAIGELKEPEFYFISFNQSRGVSSEGYARIVRIQSRRIYYALPFLALLRLWLEVRKFKPDIIHVEGGNISPYLLYMLFFVKKEKKVVTFHSHSTRELVARGTLRRKSVFYFLLKWLEKETVRRTDLIIAVGTTLAIQIDQIHKSAQNKTISIPNGVDTVTFSPRINNKHSRKQLNLTNEDFIIFHAKAFELYNGQIYLIKAMIEIASKIPEAKLVLAGDGSLLLGLQSLCAELGLVHRTIFLGHVPHDQLPYYLAASDVVVVPSVRVGDFEEGSGIFLLEAMASQKPVIATEVGGFRDSIVNGENGLLIPDKDPSAISDAVSRIFHDRALGRKLAENARKYVVEERTWGEVTERLLRAYEELDP